MKRTMSRVLIITGCLMLFVAGALFVYSRVDDYLAGQRAQGLLDQAVYEGWDLSITTNLDSQYGSPFRSSEALENPDDDYDSDDEGEPLEFSVIGVLEIPKLNIRLPVLDKSTHALLNISVCKFSGQVNGKPERLVIAGHNYRSHFGEIYTLLTGDEVLFTTREGETFRYGVLYIESCHMDESEAVQAGEEWDMTLLTCQRDRTMRTLVRLREEAW